MQSLQPDHNLGVDPPAPSRQLALAPDPAAQTPAPEIALAPYYQDERVTLYHGDCREIMAVLAPAAASLLLTDPPYGTETQINRRREKLPTIAGDDGSLDVPAALTQACRLLRRGRHAYVFGPADLANTPLCAAVQLIWDKQIHGTGDLALPWAPRTSRLPSRSMSPPRPTVRRATASSRPASAKAL